MNRLAGCLALVLLAGCATNLAQREGLDLIDAGQFEEGLAKLEQAARDALRDVGAQMALTTQRERAVKALLSNADLARASGTVKRPASPNRIGSSSSVAVPEGSGVIRSAS